MDRFFRFSDYDIWAYLSSGMLAIAAWDLSHGTSFVLRSEWTVGDGVITIFASYILGQILATPSSWLLEKIVVHKFLGAPSDNLFTSTQSGIRGALKATLLSGFYRPLEPDIREKIDRQLIKKVAEGESRFWSAYSVAKRDPYASVRMHSFLNLYGFCRNVSFVGMLSAAIIAIEIYRESDVARHQLVIDELWTWFFVSLIASLLMFQRFLKFYRLYSVEVFLSLLGNEDRV